MKVTTIHTCSNCGAQFPKWAGRCTECGKWSTIAKEPEILEKGSPVAKAAHAGSYSALSPIALADAPQTNVHRITTGLEEVDRVLGGGIVPGSILVLGGEPGIGKSTLVLQIANALTRTGTVLYVSGEESAHQILGRAQRLSAQAKDIAFVSDTRVEYIASTITATKPILAIVDSINTVYSVEAEGAPGGITQVKAAAAKLTECAKTSNIPILLIAHVNKEGGVAGPKTLEHLVDGVFVLEGDRSGQLRLLRSIKNRFGAAFETGVFTMETEGLVQVSNPSALLLSERAYNVPGTVVTSMMEGTRALLVEVQALIARTTFGMPARKASGFDVNRLQILIAVLSRRLGLPLDSHDVFVNVSGGVRLTERAADLAVALALVSALQDKTISKDIIAIGEIGLGGEIRSVPHLEARLREAEKLGFTYAIIPTNHQSISSNMKIAPVKNVEELVNRLIKDS